MDRIFKSLINCFTETGFRRRVERASPYDLGNDAEARLVGYGNNDSTGGLTQFWLQSSLTISPDEQVDFLHRLHSRKLPFSAKTVDTVLDIMTLAQAGQTIFRGKTGSAFDAKKNIPKLGWFIGSVSSPSGHHCFATRITGGENPSGITARKITESILRSLSILPAQK